jgi:hypothetical protein
VPTSNVKEQLQLALDEQTPDEVLCKIWQTSRSVKVRKAVASNPNASPWLLRSAARLYLEEVLSNPGFSILELFNDDPWILKISTAYANPWDFLIKHGSSLYHTRAGAFDYFGWAALLSPNLCPNSMDKILGVMSAGAFRRALKSKVLFNKLSAIYSKVETSLERWPFSLETMIHMYRERLIGREQLFAGLSNYGPGSTSARKSVFTKYIKSIHSSYLSAETPIEKKLIPKILAKSLLISRSHTIQWLWNCFNASELEQWAGELYCEVLGHMSNYTARTSTLVHDNVRAVGNIVAQHVKMKFFSGDCTAKSITDAYNFLKANNLQSQKFSKFGFVLSSRGSMDELDKCSLEVKKFFCKAGCLGNWASVTSSDVKYKIINDVNEHIYLNEGVQASNLLFNKCSVRKVVSLDSDCHVL